MTSSPNTARWIPFFEAARSFLDFPAFEDHERGYKLIVAGAVAELASVVRSDGDVTVALSAALGHKHNNLLSWQLIDNYKKWQVAEPASALAGLRSVFDASLDTAEALGAFLETLPNDVISGRGTRLSLGSFFLMGRSDPEATPIYRTRVVKDIKALASWESEPNSDVEEYLDALSLFEEFRQAANEAGVPVESALHAQGLLYAIAKWKPSEDWPIELTNAVTNFRRTMGMSTSNDLATAVAEYDREGAAERLAQAAAQRADFVERFPPTAWETLTLEQYALGIPDSIPGLSHALEFGSKQCGSISGGSANKHMIYFSSARDAYKFETKYDRADEAWAAIRSGAAELIERASEDDFAAIDEIDALWAAPSVRTKLAWMYFPDRLLPIYAESHLDFWLSIFDVKPGKRQRVGKNRLLFDTLTALPEFEGWQTLEIMHFLYSWANPNPGHAIVKVAPGDNARLWDDCLQSGRIRLGWDEIDDLSQFETDDELRAQFERVRPEDNKSTTTRTVRALRTFRDLEDGDIVLANRGTKQVVGIGRVTGGYRYDADLPEYRHTVEVDWFDTTERTVDFGAPWMFTLVSVTPDDYHRILRSDAGGTPEDVPLPSVPALHKEAERLLERSGQIIFYGPPGTGKTYAARRHAAWLLGGGSSVAAAATAFGEPNALTHIESELLEVQESDQRPSWLVVANPSRWSFDRLFETGREPYDYGSLSRNYDVVQPGDEVFGYEATPVKQIVAKARISRSLYVGDDDKQRIEIEPVERPSEAVAWETLRSDPVLASSEPVTNRMQGTLFRLEPHEAARLRSLLGMTEETQAVGAGAAQLTRVTFHPTYAYEDFIEGYKPTESGSGGLELTMRDGVFKRVCRAAAADSDRSYVVMIDEINRGNVPKIFGELITLIEKDKRGMPLTLPQSGHPFHVPPNVHIIATMNTADRSVHVLDSALRRRFAFVELMPEPALLTTSIGRLALEDFLSELNSRVRELIGREKQIGHAILMKSGAPIATAAEFALSFKYELLPLLQEYAYGNYNDLAELLGPEVIDEDQQRPNLATIDEPERLIDALAKHLGLG